jgi:hypothetical protein
MPNDVISKIETGERPPAEDFPPRLDAVSELDTRGALARLWDHLKKGQKQRLYGWFQEWAGIEAQATVLRWDEPLVVPGLLQTEDYARAQRVLPGQHDLAEAWRKAAALREGAARHDAAHEQGELVADAEGHPDAALEHGPAARICAEPVGGT